MVCQDLKTFGCDLCGNKSIHNWCLGRKLGKCDLRSQDKGFQQNISAIKFAFFASRESGMVKETVTKKLHRSSIVFVFITELVNKTCHILHMFRKIGKVRFSEFFSDEMERLFYVGKRKTPEKKFPLVKKP